MGQMRLDDIAGFLWHLSQFGIVFIRAEYGDEVVQEVRRRYERRWGVSPRIEIVEPDERRPAGGWRLVAPEAARRRQAEKIEKSGQPQQGPEAGRTESEFLYTLEDLPDDLLEQILSLPPLDEDLNDIPLIPAEEHSAAADPEHVLRAMELLYESLVDDLLTDLSENPPEILDPADLERLARERMASQSRREAAGEITGPDPGASGRTPEASSAEHAAPAQGTPSDSDPGRSSEGK